MDEVNEKANIDFKDDIRQAFIVCKYEVMKFLSGKKIMIFGIIVYYFPHVFTEDYAAGWYDKVEAMQGKYDTFYAGCLRLWREQAVDMCRR